MQKHTTIQPVSILNNGHEVLGVYKIGTVFNTQWGPRKVVLNQFRTLDTKQTEPNGV